MSENKKYIEQFSHHCKQAFVLLSDTNCMMGNALVDLMWMDAVEVRALSHCLVAQMWQVVSSAGKV